MAVALLALSIVLGASPGYGRVFSRWRAARHSNRAVTALGGRLAYEADVTINGGRGHLAVFSFARPRQSVAKDLERAFKTSFASAGGRGATATVNSEGLVIKLIAFSPEDLGQTLLFKLAQTDRDHRQSLSADRLSFPAGIPSSPDVEINTVMVNKETGTTLVTANTGSQPAALRVFYDAAMRSAGWRKAAPGTRSNDEVQSMTVYVRGPEVCCVLSGEGSMTLLHKRHGTK